MEPTIEKLTKTIAIWRDKPAQMVGDLFGMTPDPWQADALDAFAVGNRLALQGSRGTGNSILLAWLAWNFLLTRAHARVAVAAVSADNLRDNFWVEMTRMWDRAPLLQKVFVHTSQRFYCKDHPITWSLNARVIRHAHPEDTFAGIFGEKILVLVDEAGSVSPLVLPAAEASVNRAADSKIVVAGAPSTGQGLLHLAVVGRGWPVVRATGDPDDPRRSPRINVEWAKEQIKNWGRESPYVRMNVLGEFP